MLIRGITSEVAGMISATININTVMARRLVITSVMRSPESGGRKNDSSVRAINKRTELQFEKSNTRKWGGKENGDEKQKTYMLLARTVL